MGIYIKGMEMPKDNCDAFREIIITNNLVDGKIQMLAHDLQTNEFIGEAIELPPHGRLIDADAFSTKIIEIIERQKYDDFYAKSISVGEILREVVSELRGESLCGFNNAPTIIEAEVGE